MKETKVLIIGLGSMGKRRARNLQAIGIKAITGFDTNERRCLEARESCNITVTSDFEKVVKRDKFDVWIISVPPHVHHVYMQRALALQVPAFVEASVVDTNMKEIIAQAGLQKTLIAPSCTLYFHPAIKKIFELVNNGALGVISNFLYHSGQFLPDWHTYEEVKDYYVSLKETGGAREIVPFELTWITKLLGFPARVAAMYKKTIEIKGASEIEDTYNLLLDYNTCIFNLSVDVVSRYATRRLTINGDKKQLIWNWDDNAIKLYDPLQNNWELVNYDVIAAHDGYNKNITEQMYIDEMRSFVNAALYKEEYANSLEHDHKVLELLYAAEKSSNTNQILETI